MLELTHSRMASEPPLHFPVRLQASDERQDNSDIRATDKARESFWEHLFCYMLTVCILGKLFKLFKSLAPQECRGVKQKTSRIEAFHLKCFLCPIFSLIPHSIPPVIPLEDMRSRFLSQRAVMPGSQQVCTTSRMACLYWEDVLSEHLILFFFLMKAPRVHGCS